MSPSDGAGLLHTIHQMALMARQAATHPVVRAWAKSKTKALGPHPEARAQAAALFDAMAAHCSYARDPVSESVIHPALILGDGNNPAPMPIADKTDLIIAYLAACASVGLIGRVTLLATADEPHTVTAIAEVSGTGTDPWWPADPCGPLPFGEAPPRMVLVASATMML